MHIFSIKSKRQCVFVTFVTPVVLLQKLHRLWSTIITVTSTNLDLLYFLPLVTTPYAIHSLSGFPFISKSSSRIPHTDSIDFNWSVERFLVNSNAPLTVYWTQWKRAKRDKALNSCFQNGVIPQPITLRLFLTNNSTSLCSRGAACLIKSCAEQ